MNENKNQVACNKQHVARKIHVASRREKLAAYYLLHTTEKGFTLIELILVVAMMILLGTLSSSFAARFLTQNGVTDASDQLIGDIREAQINAMTGKQNSNWGVNYSSGTITLYKGNSYATRNAIFDEKFSVSASISITGFSDVNFARMTGIPSATPTITISGSGETKTITINSQGVATR